MHQTPGQLHFCNNISSPSLQIVDSSTPHQK